MESIYKERKVKVVHLIGLLKNIEEVFCQMKKFELDGNPALSEAEKMIEEEFRGDFRSFVEWLEMPRAEFVAYWEGNRQCQEAISKALNPSLTFVKKSEAVIKAIMDYRSVN